MEKKINKYFLLTLINLIPAIILGGGLTYNALILVGVLVLMAINFLSIVKIVRILSQSMVNENSNAPSPMLKVMLLFGLKFLLLGVAFAGVYLLNKNLVIQALLMMIFQLIILILSIKNNYLK